MSHEGLDQCAAGINLLAYRSFLSVLFKATDMNFPHFRRCTMCLVQVSTYRWRCGTTTSHMILPAPPAPPSPPPPLPSPMQVSTDDSLPFFLTGISTSYQSEILPASEFHPNRSFNLLYPSLSQLALKLLAFYTEPQPVRPSSSERP